MQRAAHRRFDPPPHRSDRLRHVLLGLACAICLSACAGGSGSSGFDVQAENDAIDQALGSQQCAVNDGLTICASQNAAPTPGTSTPVAATPTSTRTPTSSPSPTTTPIATSPMPLPTTTPSAAETPAGSPRPTPTIGHFTATVPLLPTATATPTVTATLTSSATETPSFTPTPTPAVPSIDTNIGPDGTIVCTQPAADQPCTFIVMFEPRSAPVDAAYWVALRTRNPDSAWLVVPATDNSAALVVNPARRYQIAVLLFEEDPGSPPAHVALLADTGADFAFVTPLLIPVRSGPAG